MKLICTLRYCAFLCLMSLFGCEKMVEKIGPVLVLNGDPNFGETWAGEKITRNFVVKNSGGEQATGLTLQLPEGYTSTKSPAPGNVAPKDSLLFDVTFAPNASGVFSGDLIVKRSDNNAALTKTLTGKAWDKIWDKAVGGSSSDAFTELVMTSDGGHLLGGFSTSGIFGDKTQAARGQNDYWVVKTNTNGDKIWDKTFGGDQNDFLASILPTADGGYLLGGRSNSGISGDKSQSTKNDGDEDYWIVKINANGDKQWDKTYGGFSFDILRSMVATADGGYLLGGESASGISADKTQVGKGSYDLWIVKISANGDKIWDKSIGGSNIEGLSQIVPTSDGGFLLAASSTSGISGDKTQAAKGEEDFWVVKINANGDKLWDRAFGGTKGEYLASVITTSDGGFLLGGGSSSGATGDKTQASKGENDFWVVKINANGDKLWDRAFGGNGYDYCTQLAGASDGTIIIAGTSSSGISGDKTQASKGENDYWIVKMNANGDKVWDRAFGGTQGESLDGIVATPDGGFLLGGQSMSAISGDKTHGARGAADYWIVKIK